MPKPNQKEIKEILKYLKNKYKPESVQYMGYNRFALINSRRLTFNINETDAYLPKIREYRLTDAEGILIDLEREYNFIEKFTHGVAVVSIREVTRDFKAQSDLAFDFKRKEGLIDINGKELLPCIYDSINVHLDGFVEISKGEVKKGGAFLPIIEEGKFDFEKAMDWN
ncbi:MAG TPA: WG repeat-containing protein [Bacteroidales bacterium]|jgi:hypothetical protein|nr:WG repeat-containing protein [Saprospiraceae bacterium]HPR74328.1 WG repeat-containing protein [Bacteroidales bacterium]